MLSQFLVSEVWAFLLVFCRLGSAFMMMPGFGEAYVSPRFRLMIALFFSFIISQAIPDIPEPPQAISTLFRLVGTEIIIGLFFGGISRMLIAGVQIAGGIISYQSSMSVALTNNTTGFSGQDTTISNLLAVTAIVLMFTMDMHHLLIQALAESYMIFAPGEMPFMADVAKHATNTISSSFRIAMQLSAPHLVVGLLLYLGSGIIARLMPNLQIFFIMMPGQLFLSFFVLMSTISAILMWYMDYLQTGIRFFIPG